MVSDSRGSEADRKRRKWVGEVEKNVSAAYNNKLW